VTARAGESEEIANKNNATYRKNMVAKINTSNLGTPSHSNLGIFTSQSRQFTKSWQIVICPQKLKNEAIITEYSLFYAYKNYLGSFGFAVIKSP
jgi:hypothetical protein